MAGDVEVALLLADGAGVLVILTGNVARLEWSVKFSWEKLGIISDFERHLKCIMSLFKVPFIMYYILSKRPNSNLSNFIMQILLLLNYHGHMRWKVTYNNKLFWWSGRHDQLDDATLVQVLLLGVVPGIHTRTNWCFCIAQGENDFFVYDIHWV